MSKEMKESMNVGTQMIEQVWEKIKPEELPMLRQAPRERILVIKGSYDDVENILRNAKVPYTLLDEFPQKGELTQGGKYSGCRVLFVNCDDSYHNRSNGFEDNGLTRANKKEITDFVESGGRMVTTDWAQAVVRYLFGKISAREASLEQETIKVDFPTELARKLAGLRYGNVHPRWFIEDSSDKVSYKKDSGVIQVITSEELKKRYNSENIAVAFKQGNGEVFHFVSHLIAQKLGRYNKRDRKSLQTLIDETGAAIRSKKNIGLGKIETSYTLMSTVLELCRDTKIL